MRCRGCTSSRPIHTASDISSTGAGFVRTLLLTYTPALYAAGAACLVAAVVVLAIRRPAKAVAVPAAVAARA